MENVFFERFAALCDEASETPNSVAKAIGKSSGSVTAWKNGTSPRTETVQAIARFFGVSVDYLTGNTDAKIEETKNTPTDEGERKISKEELKFALFGSTENIDDDDLDDVFELAAIIKRRKHKEK